MDNEGVALKVSIAADKVGKQIKDTNKELDSMSSKLDKISKLASSAFKTTGIIAFTKSIGNIITSMMKASEAQAEYAESVNLLNNAYGSLNNSGRELIDTMEYFYGLDPSNVTRQLGVFRQMSNAMNIAGESADMLSENFTKMAEDVSSLYNIDYSVAAKKLQSGFAGQVRPLRELGADITQAALQQELYNRGIDEQVSNLNRASKSVLIYLTLERQLSNAQGDASNTIESMSNQMRIFKEQVAIAGRQIGAVFIPILKSILPIANAILMVFNDIMSIILTFLGADVDTIAPDINKASKSYYDFGDALDGVGSSAKGATKAIKDLNKTSLRSFDKLNNIQTPQSASGGAGGGAGGGVGKIGGVDKRLLDQLEEYNLGLDDTLMKARKIANWIEKWLIYTDDAGKKHLTWLGKILSFLGIGGLIYKGVKAIKGAWDFVGGILSKTGLVGKGTAETAKTTGLIKKFIDGLGMSLGDFGLVFMAIAGNIKAMYKSFKDFFKNLKEGKSVWKSWVNLDGGVGGVIDKLIATKDIFEAFPIPTALFMGWAKLEEDINNIKNLISKIQEAWSKVTDWIKDKWDKITGGIKDALGGVKDRFIEVGDNIQSAWTNFTTPIIDALKSFGNYLNTYFVEPIAKIYKGIIKWFSDLYKSISQTVKDIVHNIVGIIEGIIETIGLLLQAGIDWLNEHIFKPIGDAVSKIWENITTTTSTAIDGVKTTVNDTWTSIRDFAISIWTKISDKISDVWNTMVTKASEAWEGIKRVFKPFADFFGNLLSSAWEKIKKAFTTGGQIFKGITEGISNAFANIVNHLIDGINKVIKVPFDAINAALKKIKNIKILDKKPFEDKITTISVPKIPKLSFKAEGGFVSDGEIFVAREAGPEMVGTINGRTAVANNDQIVEAISIGVAKAMSGTSRNTNVVIEANGDTQGLMNFITFKQKEKNRQFGL